MLLACPEPEAQHLRGLMLSSESRSLAAFLLAQSAKYLTFLAIRIAVFAEACLHECLMHSYGRG